MSDESEGPNIGEEMVKKVRRVKGGRRSKQSKTSSGPSLFSKGKDLLKGIQDEEDDSGHVDVAEQVRRLTKDKDEERPLDEVWGSKKRSTSWIWIILLAVIIPLIGVSIGISMLTKDKRGQEDEGFVPIVLSSGDEDEIPSPHAWFDEDSMVMLEEAVRIIRAINSSESPADFIGSVRTSAYREFNPVDLSQWSSPVVIKTLQDISWALPTVKSPGASDVTTKGFLQINARRENRDPVSIFFVEEDGKLLLDWDATTVWSEMPVAEVLEKKPRGGALLRAKIEKKASYDEVINGVTYSGYLVTSADGADFFFCYVPLSSEKRRLDDERIKTILNYGRFIGRLRGNLPLTMRVRYGDGKGGGKRFEIVDLIHDKWVRP